MGVESFQKASAGNRSAKRARVLLAAKLQTSFGEVEARLRDLSRKGALVECAQVPSVGSEVVFVRGETVVSARVAWAADNRVGLEFDQMIDAHELLVHVGKPARAVAAPPAYVQSYRRAGLGQGMSADDRKVAQAWSVAVGLNLPEGKN
jgi:PilZ domain